MNDAEKLFSLSVVNGADNRQELLPVQGWNWPKGTWLQTRLRELSTERHQRVVELNSGESTKRGQG